MIIFLPLWLAGGMVHPMIGYGIALLTMIYWYTEGKQHYFIMAFIFVLVMADSHSSKMNFQANLRIPILFFLMFFALEAFYRGKFGLKKVFFDSLPFFFVAFVVIINSPTPTMAFAKTISYLFLLFIVTHYLPYTIKITKGKLIIDIAYFVTALLIFSYMLIPIAPKIVIWRAEIGGTQASFRSFFSNPNGLGLYATMLTPFFFILAHIFENKRMLLAIATGLFLFSVALAGSRTSLGSILLFFGLYIFHVYLKDGKHLWQRRIGNWGVKILWFFIIPIGILIVASFGITDLIELAGLGEALEVHTIETGAGRFVAWEHAISEIEKAPWFGRGFHYDVHHFREVSDILYKLGHSGGSHNSYLSFILNIGIVGLLCFFYFLFKLFRQIKGKAKNFIVPYVFLILLSSNFEAWLASSINYITIFFYLTIILLIYYDEFKEMATKEKNRKVLLRKTP